MTTIYRFSYSPNFHALLNNFATIHRFDQDRKQFKEAWKQWLKDNKEAVDAEITVLRNNGFKGTPYEKMYKSVRYYYRKKPFMDKIQKDRKEYTSMNRDIINKMDEHCKEMIGKKPESAFQAFIRQENYNSWKDSEQTRLEIDDRSIYKKMQKTYKNRFYKI